VTTADLSLLLRVVADHVWQSTLFAGAIAVLALAFRRHRASLRYWLWLTASLKFAVPFAALIALGSSLGWTKAPLPQPSLRLAVQGAAQPFTPAESATRAATARAAQANPDPWLDPSVRNAFSVLAAVVWLTGTVLLLIRWTTRWVRLRRLTQRAAPMVSGREVEILRQIQRGRRNEAALQMVTVDSALEPGVIGTARPILLWPASISGRLDDRQIAAIFEHELAHVRRQDNLTAALHMVIEAVFWFHPLVWWITARLVDERERACDEAVLDRGNSPEGYAEGILRTCEYYLEAPLPCVTGVTGADLKKRIETIMRHRPAIPIGPIHAAVLSAFAVTAIAAPITIGVLRGPRLLAAQAPAGGGAKFDAVSVKRNTSGAQGGTNQNTPGRFAATNISLRMLIRNAYGLLDSQIVSGPALATAEYMNAEKFDIVATWAGEVTREQRNEMMQNLLKERFKLVTHTEMREMPVYVLSLARPDARLGPALKPESEECAARGGGAGRAAGPPPADPPPAGGVRIGGPGGGPDASALRCGSLQFGPGSFIAKGAGLDMLTESLANRTPITGIDRIVLDRTGLTGRYDYELKWTPVGRAGGAAPVENDPDRPSIFTALQEQLGLKLEPQRAPIEVLVIDGAAMPTEN
jgi:uncharacterized protein (TIGR03435 family)